jgi:hypothetical protein
MVGCPTCAADFTPEGGGAVDIISGAIFVLFVVVLFLAFRGPELYDALFVSHKFIRPGEYIVTVRITSEGEGTHLPFASEKEGTSLTFHKVDWLDVLPLIKAVTEPNHEQQAKPIRERIRFWHIATIIALIGAIVVLVVSSDEQNQAGAWSVIGAVIGVLIKPSASHD